MNSRTLHGAHDPLAGVRRALATSPVAEQRLTVSLDAETLLLEGTVRSWYHKQVAQEAVRRVTGVERVRIRNRIAVCN